MFTICSSIALFTTETKANSNYFVSLDGSDVNEGTKSNPFRTIQHAINTSIPGDTINVRKGIYYELLSIYNIGQAQQKTLTIQTYNNEVVIIDGSRSSPELSNLVGFSIEDSSNITIQGFEIRNIITSDDNLYPAGIKVRGQSKNIVVQDNNIHHIENNHPEGNAHGIIFYGNSLTPIQNIRIINNTLHHLKLGRSESLTISGNVTNFTINKNYLYNNNNIGIDIAGHYEACSEQDCIDIARNGTITNNLVINHSSAKNPAYDGSNSAAGIYVDGGQNIRINHNFVANNNYGLSISSENVGKEAKNVIVQNNTIVQNEKAGMVIGGSSSSNGGTSNIKISSNRFIHNNTSGDGYQEITIQQHNQSINFKENLYITEKLEHHVNNVSENEFNLTFKEEKFYTFIVPYLKLSTPMAINLEVEK